MNNLVDLYHVSDKQFCQKNEVVELIPSQPGSSSSSCRKKGVYSTFLGWVDVWAYALNHCKNKNTPLYTTPLYDENKGFYIYQLVELEEDDNCFYGLDNYIDDEYIEAKVNDLKTIEKEQDNHAYQYNALEVVFEKPMKAKLIGKLIAHKEGYSKIFNKYHWDKGIVKKTTEIADNILEVILY